jgi:hypothetical protein
MALKTIYVDDLDGTFSEDVSPVEFSLDGTHYTIDLGAPNAKQLREALATFIDHARRVNGSAATPTRKSGSRSGESGGNREQLQAIRDWARANGHTVSDRGRLSRQILDAFEAAH